MGRKIVLTGTTLTDTDAPRLATIDRIESAGSLYLIDPAHPKGAWAGGVPASGATVPNLFGDTLTALGGAGETDPAITIGGTINNGTKGSVERSAKGGLHVIVSQTTALASGDGVKMVMPAALNAYLVANPTHDYYISVWDRLTRAETGLQSSEYIFSYSTMGSSLSNGVLAAAQDNWYKTTAGTILASDTLGGTVGPRFANGAVDAATMVTATTISAGPNWGAPASSFNATNLASRNNKWPSFVFYRFYIEDLTVSGRSYAEVDAIDHALYTKEVLTPGGRYYGDTYTDPATIP